MGKGGKRPLAKTGASNEFRELETGGRSRSGDEETSTDESDRRARRAKKNRRRV
jgi:hypothetical protein